MLADGNHHNALQLVPTNGTATNHICNVRRVLADGNYYITNVGGSACANYLSGAACSAGDTVALAASDTGTGQVWTLTYSSTASDANVYTVACATRTSCNQYLSAPACAATGLGFASAVRVRV